MLVVCVRWLVRTVRAPVIAKVPLAPEQEVELAASGAVVLSGAGPRFTRRFSGLDFTLTDRELGREVRLRRVLLPVVASGWQSVRVTLRRGAVERPGCYSLRVTGLDAREDGARHFVVFSRP